ncbi:MAG: phytanoyl-CoA dioxygenase family protein, partial [Hyphomicrobiales bacterium]|nr:phytanoyl-CoA dioxygenase family protein [Hyphomicrobiales bacterium]
MIQTQQALECLSADRVDAYRRDGYLLVENRVSPEILDRCRDEIARIGQEAATLTTHSDHIDLEPSHTPETPRIRRIKLPHTISPVFDALMRSDAILAPVRDLLGPNLRLQTSKLNMKSARYGAPVDWHQDWAFYPQTNDDMLAVGVFLDDVGPENGPLMVFPGTHRGVVFDHHCDGFFAGTMSLEKAGLDIGDAVRVMAPAGSISIHHVRIVHGSDTNRSPKDRAVVFYEIASADAFPIVGSAVPFHSIEAFNDRMLCGETT